MAGNNNYKLLIEGELSTKNVQATISAFQKKATIFFNLDLNSTSVQKLNKILDDLKAKGNTIGKIKLFENDKGGINSAIIEYKNQAGQVEKITRSINSGVKITKERYVDVAKAVAGIAKVEQDRLKLNAKQADEMARAAQNAEKFLSKYSSANKNDSRVSEGMSIAQQLKVAASTGDIDSVRKLSSQLDIAKASLSGVNQGIRGWTASLGNAIKQTVSYSLSIGLVYGALKQFQDGIEYVKELNKELVNIQLVTGDTTENTAKLAVEYNNLAKEMGATTLEVTRGSLEFIRQGKSAEDTATLIRNSTMMSKLGNMEAAESSEALTSIMNGYKLEAKDTGEVVSKLVSIKFVETHSNMWIN